MRSVPALAGARSLAWVIALGALLSLSACSNDAGLAESVPGVVAQSGSAADQEITVKLESATFSGAGVSVDLKVSTTRPDVGPAGLDLPLATLDGVAPVSAGNHGDGRSIILFPAEAWPRDAETALLRLGGVRLIRTINSEVAGGIETVTGTWELAVQLPQGEEAERAAAVERLPLAEFEMQGQTVTVETLRTASETVVRLSGLPSIAAWPPPSLKAGDRVLTSARADQPDENSKEIWFEATPDDVPLTLLFPEAIVRDPTGDGWSLELALGEFTPPDDIDSTVRYDVEWQPLEGVNAPEVVGVTWQRRAPRDYRLQLTVLGTFTPPLGVPPVARGDGEPLRVTYLGNHPAQNGLPAITLVTARLEGPEPPRELYVEFDGATTTLPPFEVSLRP